MVTNLLQVELLRHSEGGSIEEEKEACINQRVKWALSSIVTSLCQDSFQGRLYPSVLHGCSYTLLPFVPPKGTVTILMVLRVEAC